MNSNTLFLYTQNFPFGRGEVFIENELKIISKYFDKITIITTATGEQTKNLPDNIQVRSLRAKERITFFRFLCIICSSVFLRELLNIKKTRGNFLYYLHYYNEALRRAEFIKEECPDDTVIHYSFWTDEWALALALLKRRNVIKNFSSKVHGYDLFEERYHEGKIPFRRFLISKAKTIYSVASASKAYLLAHYPEYKDKFKLYHLGVFDNGLSPLPVVHADIVAVSCSNIISIKRVDLIAKSLMNCEKKIVWYHFGDGLDEKKVKLLVSENSYKNIEAHFMGHVANSVIIDFYKKNPISFFIHLSETEGGVPVAIQEAISFGIPVIGADSGGVSEAVNERTGVLLSHNPDDGEIIQAIEVIWPDCSSDAQYRKAIRSFWYENFNAEVNYTNFALDLLSGK